MSDAERALYREHGELASRMCLHGLTEAEASRLEAVRSALDEIEMRKMGPGLERLQARADAVGELRDKVLALVADVSVSDRASRFDAVDANGGARWEMRDGTRVVLMFGSYDRKYHLARYRPFTGTPREVLCGRYVDHLTYGNPCQWVVRTHICYECEALGRVAVEADGPRLSGKPDGCGHCIVCLDDCARWQMVTCVTCGNKRCPKATDHALACSGSNEPGQAGSVYEMAKQ